MRLLRFLLVICLYSTDSGAAQTQPDRESLYFPFGVQLQTAITNPAPVANIRRIVREAEEAYGESAPAVVVRVLSTAVARLGRQAQNEPDSASTVFELTVRERKYIEFVDFSERIWRLGRDPLPLATEVEVKAAKTGEWQKTTELALLLKNWQDLEDENERTKAWDTTLPPTRPRPPPSAAWPTTNAAGVVFVGFATESSTPEQVQDPQEREEFRAALAAYRHDSEQRLYRAKLRNEGNSFTNAVKAQIAREYASAPHLLAQLQEVMDGYLPPEVSTPVMDKVFESMPRDVAAKTPRPVPGVKGERWIRVAAPMPRGEPGLPAIARPSKLRDAMGVRAGPDVVAPGAGGKSSAAVESAGGPEQAGGRPLWHWLGLGLGLVVVAGGWVWLRAR